MLSVSLFTCNHSHTFFGSCILWGASTDISTDTSVDISVDTSVDTRPSIGRYSIEYRSIYWSRVDRCIDRQSYRSKYLAVHRYLTDTWPIFDRYLTVTWPILDRYFTDASPILYIGRYSTDTRPVDKANIKVPAKIRVTSENFLPNSIFYLLQLNWWNVYQLILKG